MNNTMGMTQEISTENMARVIAQYQTVMSFLEKRLTKTVDPKAILESQRAINTCKESMYKIIVGQNTNLGL